MKIKAAIMGIALILGMATECSEPAPKKHVHNNTVYGDDPDTISW